MTSAWTRAATFTAVAILLTTPLGAQVGTSVAPVLGEEQFQRPPDTIASAVLAPWHRNATLSNPSPDGQWFVDELRDGPPSMMSFARPFLRLGGLQVDPRANRDRELSTRAAVGLRVTALDGTTTDILLPDGMTTSAPTWSPDGSRIAFLGHQDDGTRVYVADPASGRSRQVSQRPVLATLVTSLAWTPDSRGILTVLIPEGRGPAPVPPLVPTGPQVRQTTPVTNRIRTYPDLLEGPHERAMLEYYTTGELALIAVESERSRPLGAPGMIRDVTVSPDGHHVLVELMSKPFSHIVPVRQFGTVHEIWSLDGAVVATVNVRPIQDGSPSDTLADDPSIRRHIGWLPDGGLGFARSRPSRATDGSRERRGDRIYRATAPFDSSATHLLHEAAGRVAEFHLSRDATVLFVSERDDDRVHDYAVYVDDPGVRHTLWRGERPERRFRNQTPTLVTHRLANGVTTALTSGDTHVFMTGIDYGEDPVTTGPISYLQRVDIRRGTSERIYESDNEGVFERLVAVLDPGVTTLLVTRESPSDVPDSYLRDLNTGELRPLTGNRDYLPDITQADRRRYDVTRADGFEFAVNVTLPTEWSGERLPGLIWFYPREYVNQNSYDETRETWNRNAFPTLRARSMDILIRHGYAVIAPDAPIIGPQGRMNDNYVHDLRNNLSATIDFLEREGIIDRERLAVGGHSYGAFSTVNAMVHTPFFKAGIAGDGNFNRTLTPFAFQTERRSIWEARDLYFSMSPLFYAHNLTGALLLYHGAHDQNVGTFPIHSWRLFESLESLGKTASLYVYPFEDHGPATEETLLDLWARWTAWLDQHLNVDVEDESITDDTA